MYWYLIPKAKRRKCIFRKSCSIYVYEKTMTEGLVAGLKAFQYRYNNCKSGFHIFTNPISQTTQIILPNNTLLEEYEISERFITNKKNNNGKIHHYKKSQ
jgi:uncharacterized protein